MSNIRRRPFYEGEGVSAMPWDGVPRKEMHHGISRSDG